MERRRLARPPTQGSGGGDQNLRTHLFVLTRDISNDPSAAHVLRIALGLQRRQGNVMVFLTDNATGGHMAPGGVGALRDLVSAGGQVVADDRLLERAPPFAYGLGIEKGTEEDLAALLLRPGIHAHWC